MKLQVISEMGSKESKALLISLPQRYMQVLEIDHNGEIDTLSLLDVLKLAYDEESKALTLEEHINLMDAIFNPERAVTQKPVNRKV